MEPQYHCQQQSDDFVRMISHDLRTPLTIIIGQAQLIQRVPDRQDIVLKSAASIISASRRMNSMIQDLVDAVRLESGQVQLQVQPIDLLPFLSDLREKAKSTMDVDRIRENIPAGLPPLLADSDRLERILTNLISNALKYSPDETEVLVSAEERDDKVVIAVTDRGVGIAPQDIPHIFQRHYRTKGSRKSEGLGLGLYITRMLVEAQGGSVWVESKLGEGSTFYFALPRA